MRLAFVNTRSDAVGGAQVHVADLAGAMARQGHVVCAFTGGNGPGVDLLAERGVANVPLRYLRQSLSNPAYDARAIWEMRSRLRDFRPDLVSVHTSKAGLLGRIAAASLGLPVIYTPHGWRFGAGVGVVQRSAASVGERLAGRLADRIITVSEADRTAALRRRIAPPERIVTVYNGMPDVSDALFADPGAAPVRLVMVARFERPKDHGALLRALAAVRWLPWTLELIGGGPLMATARSLAQSLGIGGRVEFSGARRDVAERLSTAQLFVLTSRSEGLPRSIIEAMRAGLPVLASDVGGVRELVADGASGFVVPTGGTTMLRERLLRLLSDPAARVAMGRASRERYMNNFRLEDMLRRTSALYAAVIAERRPGRPKAR